MRTPRPPLARLVGRPLRRLATAVAALLAVVASLVVAAAPASASLPWRTHTEMSIANSVWHLINLERSVHHLAPLRMNLDLIHSARVHDVTMARYNRMSHQLPGEPYFGRRITDAGYHWHYAGENIAWSSSMTRYGVEVLESLMYHESPPYDEHRLNILSTHYTDVGVDVYFDNTHHKVWLTTDYGRH